MPEKLTAEESAALAAMQADDAPEPEAEGGAAPAETEPKPAPAEPEKPPETPPEPKPKPDSEDKPAEFKSTRTEADKPPEGFVPHAALHAEREERKKLQRDLEEIKAWRAEQEKAKAAPDPQWVDPLEDPEGFKKYDDHRNRQIQERLDKRDADEKVQREFTAKMARVKVAEDKFITGAPDYPAAATYLQETRAKELAAQGFTAAQISTQISDDIHRLVDAAEAIGMNPARLAYVRAQEAGYTKAAVADEGAKVVALAAAQAATQGLGSTGGGAPSGKITATQLAEMSTEELSKVPDKDIKAAMGG